MPLAGLDGAEHQLDGEQGVATAGLVQAMGRRLVEASVGHRRRQVGRGFGIEGRHRHPFDVAALPQHGDRLGEHLARARRQHDGGLAVSMIASQVQDHGRRDRGEQVHVVDPEHQAGTELGDGGGHRTQLLGQVVLAVPAIGEQWGQGPEGHASRGGGGGDADHRPPLGSQSVAHLVGQPGLADAGLADEQHAAPGPLRPAEVVEQRCSADQGCRPGRGGGVRRAAHVPIFAGGDE